MPRFSFQKFELVDMSYDNLSKNEPLMKKTLGRGHTKTIEIFIF